MPYRSSARASPATDPGTATDRWPYSFAACSTRGHAKSPSEIPSISRNMVASARAGAWPLKSIATVSPRFARWTSIVPEPASVDMKGSTTVIANAVATAASTALPPSSRIVAPTRAPRGCSATTRPRGASGVCLVTTSSDWIMVRRDSVSGSPGTA